ncbi:helix-turn-helix domain-containing protein [Marinobacter sp. DUT-3]|uniref:helix-turn-helix domain-containing protein n=1 Tax=Marinobacter sp. DUT-3 TaxID=3412036 RepID=UPI003D16BE3F
MLEATPESSVSREHFLTTVKGLRHVVDPTTLEASLSTMIGTRPHSASARIPLKRLLEFQTVIAEGRDDPLLLAKAYSHLNYDPGFMGRTFLAGALSLDEAISLLCRYMKVNSDLCTIKLQTNPDSATLRITPATGYSGAHEQLDAMVYSFSRILLALGIQSIDFIRLNHVPPLAIQDQYHHLFPAPVHFGGSEPAIQFSPEQLNRPLDWDACPVEKLAKRERRLKQLQGQSNWLESVEILIPALSRRGEAHIDRCANLLAVSPRSLQRHIRAEGSTFRVILDQSRRKLARNYLARGYANEVTASLLGYRQTAQFYRAFREWFGCSPSEYQHSPPP